MNTSDTEDAKDGESKSPCTAGRYYPALVSLAIHGQENKWWMLYIYLVFNSILLLGCSTILTAQDYQLVHKIALSVFCTAGVLVAIPWLFMAGDYVQASNLYGDIVVKAEACLPTELRPLTERAAQRVRKSRLGTTLFVAHFLPIVFIFAYLIIALLAWRPCLS